MEVVEVDEAHGGHTVGFRGQFHVGDNTTLDPCQSGNDDESDT